MKNFLLLLSAFLCAFGCIKAFTCTDSLEVFVAYTALMIVGAFTFLIIAIEVKNIRIPKNWTNMSILLIVLCLAFSSCAKNGYGCKGNSKIITRVK